MSRRSVIVMSVIALLVAAIVLGACRRAAPAPAATPTAPPQAATPVAAALPEECQGQDGTGLKVGFANLGESVPFAVQVREGIERVARLCNLQIINADNALDPQIALDNVRLFMTQQVDGIIEFNVHGNIADSICEIVGNTPMIAVDIAHPGCSVFMGANNRMAGELGGKAAGELAKKLWNCEIDAIVTHEAPGVGQVNIDRMNGQIAGLQSVCPNVDYGDFENWSMAGTKLVTRLDSDRVDPGFAKGRDYLTANQDKKRIVSLCINDDSCLGMLAAVREAGREGQVIFASQGADPSVWDEIRTNPYYAGSVAYFPEYYGRYLIPAIIRMMDGERVEGPILIDHVAITKDNIDQYYPQR
jgi:ribose transport system substrate-binding protein